MGESVAEQLDANAQMPKSSSPSKSQSWPSKKNEVQLSTIKHQNAHWMREQPSPPVSPPQAIQLSNPAVKPAAPVKPGNSATTSAVLS